MSFFAPVSQMCPPPPPPDPPSTHLPPSPLRFTCANMRSTVKKTREGLIRFSLFKITMKQTTSSLRSPRMVQSTHHRWKQNTISHTFTKESPNISSCKHQVKCPLMSHMGSLSITWGQHLKCNQATNGNQSIIQDPRPCMELHKTALNPNGNMNWLQELPILKFPTRLLPCHQGNQLRLPIGLVCPTLYLASLLIHSPS